MDAVHIGHLGEPSPYRVQYCACGELSKVEFETCIEIIKNGDAVDLNSAAKELPLATVVVIAARGTEIVGVGAVKQPRKEYASKIARQSGEVFNPELQELGYVAVDSKHKGNGLSRRIAEALLLKYPGPLFATTGNERMKRTLKKVGFVQKGEQWQGENGKLSLWIKD